MILALTAAGCVLLLLAAHPFTTYPASLRLLRGARPQPVAHGAVRGRIALCVCAYNEERVIGAKVANMLALRAAWPAPAEVDILVYVDGSGDRTAEIARGMAACVQVVAAGQRLGKTHGMNTLVGMTGADFVVFSDANVTFAADALPNLLSAFADPSVGCVCGHLIYTSPAGTATAATGSLYWRLEESIKTLESDTGSVMGADGSIFALRRALHVPPPPDLIDDMYVSLAVLCGGHRIVRAAGARAYEEAVSRPAEEFRRKVRIACQAFNVHRALWPALRGLPLLDRYKYVSHKLLRWLTVYFLAGSALCFAAAFAAAFGILASFALSALVALCVTLTASARTGKLAALRDIAAAFIATGIGVRRSLAGERFQTWNPPASARGVAMTAE